MIMFELRFDLHAAQIGNIYIQVAPGLLGGRFKKT